jgi:membrane protease YdiL (CAAX protease family)
MNPALGNTANRRRAELEAVAKAFALVLLAELPFAAFPMVSPAAATAIALVAVAIVIVVTHVRVPREDIFLIARAQSRALTSSETALTVLLAIVFAIATIALQVLYISAVGHEDPVSDIERSMLRPYGWLPVLIGAVILAPIVEESAVRGFLQSRIESTRGPVAAVILGSVFFAAIHLSIVAAPFLFAFGAVLGVVMLRVRSTRVTAALHGASNLAVGLMALSFGIESSPAELPRRLGVPLSAFAVAFVLLAVLFVAVLNRFPATGRSLGEVYPSELRTEA